MLNEFKKFEIIQGDVSELKISPVYDHINNIQQPRKKQNKEIIIPEIKRKEEKSNK